MPKTAARKDVVCWGVLPNGLEVLLLILLNNLQVFYCFILFRSRTTDWMTRESEFVPEEVQIISATHHCHP
jgi:hypothetical protein